MITIYFDGACGPKNPGGRCGGGAVILNNGQLVQEIYERYHPKKANDTSNNVGEYYGLLQALKYLYSKGMNKDIIEVYGDSNMVISQMSGEWRIKKGLYADIAKETKIFLNLFKNIRFNWIPREENEWADALSKKAIQ